MSFGAPPVVAEPVLNKREVRHNLRWDNWRGNTGAISHAVGNELRSIAQIDQEIASLQVARKEATVRLRLSRSKHARQYLRMTPLMLREGFDHLFAPIIDWWDRWITIDNHRG